MPELIALPSENQLFSSEAQALAIQLEREIGQLELGMDLDQLARCSGAWHRQRGVRSARDLLRLVLAYSVLDYSLRLVGGGPP